jgi:hypothetical protein
MSSNESCPAPTYLANGIVSLNWNNRCDLNPERLGRVAAQKENAPPGNFQYTLLDDASLQCPETTGSPLEGEPQTLGNSDSGGPRAVREKQTAARRRVAAEWVESMTGVALPTASDHAFRGALRDGVLLCQLLNKLRPGLISRVRHAKRLDGMV